MTTKESRLIDLDAVVQSATSIEPIPGSVVRLSMLVTADPVDLDAITETISLDQALAGSVLRSANSATSASRSQVATVRDAVFRLGPPTVLSIALSGSIRSKMMEALPQFGYSAGDLWQHAVLASLAAESIRSTAKVRIPVESITAALLHDIGKLVLAQYLNGEVLGMIHAAVQAGASHVDAEIEVLEVNHGELGALVTQSWGLPESISRAISYHHHPDGILDSCTDAVYLANIVADRVHHVGAQDDLVTTEELDAVCDRLALPAEMLSVLVTAVSDRFDAVQARYNA